MLQKLFETRNGTAFGCPDSAFCFCVLSFGDFSCKAVLYKSNHVESKAQTILKTGPDCRYIESLDIQVTVQVGIRRYLLRLLIKRVNECICYGEINRIHNSLWDRG